MRQHGAVPQLETWPSDLSAAILNQDDPELVRESLPAYLLLLDSLAAVPDAGPAVLGAAARLYAAYAIVFVDDPVRCRHACRRARGYGRQATCAAGVGPADLEAAVCDLDFSPSGPGAGNPGAFFSYAVGSLAYVRTHSDDWQALTELPKIEAVLNRLLMIGDAADAGTGQYLPRYPEYPAAPGTRRASPKWAGRTSRKQSR